MNRRTFMRIISVAIVAPALPIAKMASGGVVANPITGRVSCLLVHDEYWFYGKMFPEQRHRWILRNFARNYGAGPKAVTNLVNMNYKEIEIRILAERIQNVENMPKLRSREGLFLQGYNQPL